MATKFPLETMRESEIERTAYMAGRPLIAELIADREDDWETIEELEDKAKKDAETISELSNKVKLLSEQQEATIREINEAERACRAALENLLQRITAINNPPE